ncbi:hypothetical protein V1504DRAFT_472191 [Lipomyces starkeyi]
MALALDKVLLFGDSITQYCYDPEIGFCFGSAMQNVAGPSDKTKTRYRKRVKRYEEASLLATAILPPTLEKLKRFIRWYIASTDGRIDDSPMTKSVFIRSQEFVFIWLLSQWVEHTLTGDGTLKNVKREKYNFTNNDYALFSGLLSRLRRKSAGNWISKGFSIALWDHEKSQFAAANELLSLALLDNFGFNSPEEIFGQRIPDGKDELPRRWREESTERSIVRNIAGNNNAGYFKTPTVHAMRRCLGKEINGMLTASPANHSSAKVAPVLAHKTDTVYGRDYVAHGSSIGTVDELRVKKRIRLTSTTFKPTANFMSKSAARKAVNQDTQLIQLERKISEMSAENADDDTIKHLRRQHGVIKRRLHTLALQRYQTNWVQEQRDWKGACPADFSPSRLRTIPPILREREK